jgi:flagellin-like protein
MNRKAISELVSTVLLVLITIAAVGIIWGAIMPIIRSNLETSQKCANAELRVNTESGYTYLTSLPTATNITVQISRGASTVELAGIQLKFVDSKGDSKTMTNSTWPEANADKIYVYNNNTLGISGNITKIGVAALIRVGNTNFTCPAQEFDIK